MLDWAGCEMAYPTLEQYNEALQNPKHHLLDPELQVGSVRTSGLGLPIAMCGGFALTYTVTSGSKKFAVRCFHKESAELERRYAAISRRLKSLPGEYFLPFDFMPSGIRIKGSTYPVVKMAWAKGETLSEFMEREYVNPSALHRLRSSLAKLSEFLEKEGIAHGDIQPGNLMVADNGAKVQLIDYDGMYVAEFKGSRATELGQLNFQHPLRTPNYFNAQLDRFSFIVLDVALEALAADAQLWTRSQSDPDAIVFRRADFMSPASSPIFKDVMSIKGMGDAARNLAKIASGAIESVPSLMDFLQKRNIPATTISFVQTSAVARAPYQGAYPVLDAKDFASFVRAVGSRVELIGQILEVSQNTTRYGKPYVFVNFADWRGNAVKVSIWSEGLDRLGNGAPNKSWIGRWIAVSGLVEPVYSNPKYKYNHVSITIDSASQLRTITADEAKYRLGSVGKVFPAPATVAPASAVTTPVRNPVSAPSAGNRVPSPAVNIPATATAVTPRSSYSPSAQTSTSLSSNAKILESMGGKPKQPEPLSQDDDAYIKMMCDRLGIPMPGELATPSSAASAPKPSSNQDVLAAMKQGSPSAKKVVTPSANQQTPDLPLRSMILVFFVIFVLAALISSV